MFNYPFPRGGRRISSSVFLSRCRFRYHLPLANSGEYFGFSMFVLATIVGVAVHVCYQQICHLCGSIDEQTDDDWHHVDCPDGGIVGTEIKLTNSVASLHFCDIIVYGISKKNSCCI